MTRAEELIFEMCKLICRLEKNGLVNDDDARKEASKFVTQLTERESLDLARLWQIESVAVEEMRELLTQRLYFAIISN